MSSTVTISIYNNQLSAQQLNYSAENIEKILEQSSLTSKYLQTNTDAYDKLLVKDISFIKPVSFNENVTFSKQINLTNLDVEQITAKTSNIETENISNKITIRDINGNTTTICPTKINAYNINVINTTLTNTIPKLKSTTITVNTLNIKDELSLGDNVQIDLSNLIANSVASKSLLVDTISFNGTNPTSINNTTLTTQKINITTTGTISTLFTNNITSNRNIIGKTIQGQLINTNTITISDNIIFKNNGTQIETNSISTDTLNNINSAVISSAKINFLEAETAIINTEITLPNQVSMQNLTVNETFTAVNNCIVYGALNTDIINTTSISGENAVMLNGNFTNAIDSKSCHLETLNVTDEALLPVETFITKQEIITNSIELDSDYNNKLLVLNPTTAITLTLPILEEDYEMEILNLSTQTINLQINEQDVNTKIINTLLDNPHTSVQFSKKYGSLGIKSIIIDDDTAYWLISGEINT